MGLHQGPKGPCQGGGTLLLELSPLFKTANVKPEQEGREKDTRKSRTQPLQFNVLGTYPEWLCETELGIPPLLAYSTALLCCPGLEPGPCSSRLRPELWPLTPYHLRDQRARLALQPSSPDPGLSQFLGLFRPVSGCGFKSQEVTLGSLSQKMVAYCLFLSQRTMSPPSSSALSSKSNMRSSAPSLLPVHPALPITVKGTDTAHHKDP